MAETKSKLGFGLEATMEKSSKEMAEKCRAQSNKLILTAERLTKAAIHFELNEFSAGLSMLDEAKTSLE